MNIKFSSKNFSKSSYLKDNIANYKNINSNALIKTNNLLHLKSNVTNNLNLINKDKKLNELNSTNIISDKSDFKIKKGKNLTMNFNSLNINNNHQTTNLKMSNLNFNKSKLVNNSSKLNNIANIPNRITLTKIPDVHNKNIVNSLNFNTENKDKDENNTNTLNISIPLKSKLNINSKKNLASVVNNEASFNSAKIDINDNKNISRNNISQYNNALINNSTTKSNLNNLLSNINKTKPGYLNNLLSKIKEKEQIEENINFMKENKFAYKIELEKFLKSTKLPNKSKQLLEKINVEFLEKAFDKGDVEKKINQGKINLNDFYLSTVREIIFKVKNSENYQMKI